ncbi:MAG: hypothetical protein ACP5PJ_10665, partial [Acidimicrobiales bacterium]
PLKSTQVVPTMYVRGIDWLAILVSGQLEMQCAIIVGIDDVAEVRMGNGRPSQDGCAERLRARIVRG